MNDIKVKESKKVDSKFFDLFSQIREFQELNKKYLLPSEKLEGVITHNFNYIITTTNTNI